MHEAVGPTGLEHGGGDHSRAGPTLPVRRRQGPCGASVLAAISFASAAQLLLIALAVGSVQTPSQLLALSALAEAPLIGAAAAVIVTARRHARERAEQEEMKTLVSRVELAEPAGVESCLAPAV